MTAAAIAHDVLRRGYKPVPVPVGSKNPGLKEWQKLDVTPDTVPRYFDGGDQNVGALMGLRSGDLADADLDCREAVALAPYFLPRTGSIYGRAGKRRSHYLYKCPDPPPKASVQFKDEAKAMIVELRVGGEGKGAQSIWPGCLHTSGERYEWDEDGEPRRVDFADLDLAAKKIAVGTILIRHWPARGGRHDAALTVGGFLARIGWSPDAIADFVTAVATEHGEADDPAAHGRTARDSADRHAEGGTVYGLPQMIEMFGDAAAKQIAKLVGYRGRGAPEPTPSDARPVIKVAGGTLSENADDAERALIDAGIAFYERSNTIVRAIVKEVDGFHGTKTKTAQLARVGPVYMRDVLGRVAHWYRFDARAQRWVPTNPPSETAETVLARAGEWAFPSIAGIINTPTLRPDGTILDEAGFDPATRLLLIDPPKMAPIPDEPTMDDALAAVEFLKVLIKGFPLVGNIDRAVMLSAIITPVARGGFPVVPMITIDAPVAGAGKSYGLDLVSMIATGERMPVIAAVPGNPEENEKRLGAALLAGQPLVTIDNISGVLFGDALCQIIERPRPQVRILGKSTMITVETRGTSLFANGNNLIISGDLCRRVVRARLDPKMEDPEHRVFETDPLAMIATDRGAYVRAALVICRAYIAAGRPEPAQRLASFEAWSDTVRSALIWLGEADPVASMATSRAEDPERGAFRALLSAWAEEFGTGEANSKTLRDVITLATATTVGGNGYYHPTLAHPNLNAALQAAVVGQSRRNLSTTSLGYWLRSRKDAIAGPYCFRNKFVSGDGVWWVDALADEAVRPGPTLADAGATTPTSDSSPGPDVAF